MSGRLAILVLIGTVLGGGMAAAQETRGESRVDVTYMPAGAGFVASKGDSPSFGNYGFGTSVTVNVNRYIGVEGEVTTMIATTSDLQFGDLNRNIKAPNMLGYSGNIILSPFGSHALVPYVTAGIGGLSMYERPQLGMLSDQTFLTGNGGGGVKWYAPNNRWGIRADYRFAATRSKDDAPQFFGRETRYIHRIYAGILINTVK